MIGIFCDKYSTWCSTRKTIWDLKYNCTDPFNLDLCWPYLREVTWQNVRPWLLDSASHTDRTQGCRVPWGSGQSSPRGWPRFSTDRLQTAPGWGCRRIYQWIPEVCAHTLKMIKMKNVTLEYNVCCNILGQLRKEN